MSIAAETAAQLPYAGLGATVSRVDGIERRACSQALQWWRELAAPRHMPAMATVTPENAGGLWSHLFVVEVGNEPSGNRFVFANDFLRSALGEDPTGRTMREVWPEEAQPRAYFLQEAAIDLMSPIDEAGRWSRADGDVLYRCVLLPLSDDQRRVSHLLGAFSFRKLES
jgi:hypothetical protein